MGKLNEKVLAKITQQFAAKFSQTLTKKKLGQFVPVAGMAVGTGLNYVRSLRRQPFGEIWGGTCDVGHD